MDVEQLVGKWEEAVNAQQADAFGALYAPDAVLLVPLTPEPLKGREAIQQYEGAIYSAFPGATLTLSRPVGQGNTVVMEWGNTAGPTQARWPPPRASCRLRIAMRGCVERASCGSTTRVSLRKSTDTTIRAPYSSSSGSSEGVFNFGVLFRQNCRSAREDVACRVDHNQARPHSTLGYGTPEEFAAEQAALPARGEAAAGLREGWNQSRELTLKKYY